MKRLVTCVGLAASIACSKPAEPVAPTAAPVPPPATPSAPPRQAQKPTEWPATERADLVPAKAGPLDPVSPLITAELERARADGMTLVVYVGATWCEPCKRFHEALAAGALNSPLHGVRFLEFDLDRHARPLRDAGCDSELIPLFAIPTPDGRCSEQRTMGGVKGVSAVGNIMPRLLTLLGRQPR